MWFHSKKETDEERLRKLRQAMAYHPMTIPITGQLKLLFHFYKTTLKEKPGHLPDSFQELFGDAYFEELSHFNLLSEVPPMEPFEPRSRTPWTRYIAKEFDAFKTDMEGILLKHMKDLDGDTISLVDEILNSYFLACMVNLPKIATMLTEQYNGFLEKHSSSTEESDSDPKAKALEDLYRNAFPILTHPFFKYYIKLLLQLVELHNKHVEHNKYILYRPRWWTKETPAFGVSRFPEPPEAPDEEAEGEGGFAPASAETGTAASGNAVDKAGGQGATGDKASKEHNGPLALEETIKTSE